MVSIAAGLAYLVAWLIDIFKNADDLVQPGRVSGIASAACASIGSTGGLSTISRAFLAP
ncbi:hypothetical protein ACFXG6_25075 [Streptomyces roseus]|uniref:hypothetical protein n=1 Tax=Streptomyces roseus TaxID=66430 RepID=UPI0036A5A472